MMTATITITIHPMDPVIIVRENPVIAITEGRPTAVVMALRRGGDEVMARSHFKTKKGKEERKGRRRVTVKGESWIRNVHAHWIVLVVALV